MGFTNIFGGNAVRPSQVQYEAITLSANITLFWPTETQAGQTYVAAEMDISPTLPNLSLIMPDATQGTPGVASLVTNVGSNSFSLVSNTGALIATIAPGLSWIISLTSNISVSGTWRATQLAATTSNAQAAALAGAGLEAIGTQLRLAYPSQTLAANTPIGASYRANAVVWNGAAGTLSLDTVANLVVGWWCLFTNEGTDNCTIGTTGGATINGQASFVLPPSSVPGQYYSALVICTAGGFHVYGAVPSVIQVANGGTGASDAPTALVNLGGSSIGITIFTAPNAAAILAALGVALTAVTEVTIGVNTAVNTGSSSSAYHCTAALILTLPVTTSVTTSFYFYVDAHGGVVTITPNPADAINQQAAGTSYIVPQGSSVMMTTDGAGNWWPFIGGAGLTNILPWAVAGGTADAITAAYSPSFNGSLINGYTVSFRAGAANLTATPTFSPDGATPRTITKVGGVPLVPGDIAGALAECIVRYNLANTRWELLNPATTEPPWAVAGGTADAITATYAPAVGILYDGLQLGFRATAANVTTTPTFSANGSTARTITKRGGLALVSGDIPGNLSECIVRYNLASTRWELLNPAIVSTPWVAAGGTVDAITATYSPAIAALSDGLQLGFRATGANATTTPTFAPNGLTAHTITKQGGAALVAGDIAANLAEYIVRYNLANTRWELLNPNFTSPLAARAVQGILFSLTGASYSLISSFPPGAAGPTAVRNSVGNVTVTLGTTPLNVGFCEANAVDSAQADGVQAIAPSNTMSASGAYTFICRFSSSKTLTDPDRCLIRFY